MVGPFVEPATGGSGKGGVGLRDSGSVELTNEHCER
jgi:hypothetical protein